MDQHALHVLEFYKLKEHLRGFCASPMGREAVDTLQPFTDYKAIQQAQRETSEMVRLISAQQEPPFDRVHDVRQPLQQTQISGAVLDPADIVLIGEVVIAARQMKNAIRKAIVDAPLVREYGSRLIHHPQIEKALDKLFDEQKNIRDDASHELARIRRSLRQQREQIIRRLGRMMRRRLRDYLQENYYTQREGRYVLPIHTNFHNKVPGIIHDRSSTGTTVYIEPMEIVQDGNRLKELQREEYMELRKILQEVTAQIAQRYDELMQNLELFRHLDFLAAKARMSLHYELNEPIIRESGAISIEYGRHPLLLIQLGREKVVPLNLLMKPETPGLVITGPNTGGKTVVLKTLGLLVLMAQSGLPISAGAKTEIPVFQSIWADIGDEQSLEQSLSTFSSHMSHIRDVLQKADPHSLVLFDELGSGTDPSEGGALSCAILKILYEKGATFLVTTHLRELKLYAYQTEGINNGAMEFDLNTLEPTFVFTMGLPGQSNAIQIAERLGLPYEVICEARAFLGQMGDSPEELLRQMGEELRKAREMREEVGAEYRKAKNLKKEAEERVERAKRESRAITTRAERKSQNVLDELERKLREIERREDEFKKEWQARFEQLNKISSHTKRPPSLAKDIKKDIQEARYEFAKESSTPAQEFVERRDWTWDQLKPGVQVRVAGFSQPGAIAKVNRQKKQIEVAVSSMNLRVNPERIVAILDSREKVKPQKNHSEFTVDRPDEIDRELDIHGLTVEEMMPLLEQYIDRAFLAGISSVRIVHGHGFGVLRRTVRKYLKENPVVLNFREGMEFEGGGGVTIAEFKKM